MKKLSLLFILIIVTGALSANALAGNWLLYLPAILAGRGGDTPPVVETEKSSILLYLPAILAGALKSPPPPVTPSEDFFNDTGITSCASTTGKEDCNYGRDVNSNDNTNGYAGFNYTKLDSSGNDLESDAIPWSCVRDNISGLIWEVKTDDSGLHDKDDLYTWYNSDVNTNGGFAGSDHWSISCYGYENANTASYCNTEAFVNRVNLAGLCGAKDWRMPTVNELQGIVFYENTPVTIDGDYFPNLNTGSVRFWTGIPHSNSNDSDSDTAWGIQFATGLTSYVFNKDEDYFVRLVRNNQ